jgi:hypothetical protein
LELAFGCDLEVLLTFSINTRNFACYAHLLSTAHGDTARVMAMTDFTTIFTFLESIFTIHVTHDLRTFRFSTEANVTSIFIFLETMLTVHHAHELWAFVALANFAAVLILLEAMLTVHVTHDL